MAPLSSKALKVIEKFRAPAALWRPSKFKGDAWNEISGCKRGGKVIIQLQENACDTSHLIPVVRFELRHGQDVLNARIIKGLPIERVDETRVLIKVASSSSYRVRSKTINLIRFQMSDDADDFEMWWVAKNGTLKAWREESSEKKIISHSKRKAEHPAENDRVSKKVKHADTEEFSDGSIKTKPVPLQPLADSTNTKETTDVPKKRTHCPTTNKEENCVSLKDNAARQDKKVTAIDCNEIEEVLIDDGYAPQSQDWLAAFDK